MISSRRKLEIVLSLGSKDLQDFRMLCLVFCTP